MGFWDVLRGRSAPHRPNLDNLFAVPGAAITMQTALGLAPNGSASVCFRAAPGTAMASTLSDAIAVIEADDGPKVERTADSYGFTWMVMRGDPSDVSGLVTDVHAVNTGLETQGFGEGLLCSLVTFADNQGRRVGLVYLYKQGTFYPFAPTGPSSRDVLLERQVRDAVAGDITIEQDTSRWLPLWGAPGL